MIEIMIYSTLIAIVGSVFGGILLSVTKVQNRQTASTEVNQQVNFILQNVQRLIRESSAIDIPAASPISTLTLRMKESAQDPTLIYLSNNAAYLKSGASAPIALSSASVKIDNLSFTKISTFPGHDSVQVDLAASYNTENPEQQFSRSFSSAVTRVSAATFDADLIPGATSNYDIGLSGAKWRNLNLSGELYVGGVSADGTGKVVCIKSDGNLGTCSTQPNASGVCTCQ